MSINLASGLSAVTTDSTGVNHLVWLENNSIWHAQFDGNTGSWVNAQQIVTGIADNVTSINLVASSNLIQVSDDETAPGLAVVWQQGDVTQNGVSNSNFFYSAATYDSSANLQWLQTPQQLTVNENSNAENFANLNPQAIADNNGNVFVVGQQVNLIQGADQAIREDADLYYTNFTVKSSDFSSGSTGGFPAPYNPPVVVDGVNQGTTSLATTQPQPAPASYSAFTASEASSAAASASSSSGSPSWGVGFGPALTFSSDLYESLGLVDFLDGVPKNLIKSILGGYKLVGTLSGSYVFGSASSSGESALQVKTIGDVTNKREKNISGGSANFLKQFPNSPFKKPEPSFEISLSFESESEYSGTTPFKLKRIEDQITLSAEETFPIFNGFVPGTFELLRGTVDFVGSAGITGILLIEPTSTDSYSNGINPLIDTLITQAGVTPLLFKAFDNPSNGVAAMLGELVFAPFEDILVSNLAGLGNESIVDFLIGPTFSGTVNGEVHPTRTKWVKATLSGGVVLTFGFNTIEEDTILQFPISAGVSIGPISFDLSIEPTFSWTVPYNSSSSTSSSNSSNTSSSNSPQSALAIASSTSNDSQITSATVNGSLLTLNFNTPLDTTSTPSASDFTVLTQTINQTSPTSSGITVFDVLVSNDATTGNGVVTLRLNQAIPYSPQFQGTSANSAGQLGVFVSYDGTALEDSSNNAIADFSQLSVTNDSSQTSVTAYNPTSGNANNYTTTNQTSLIGNLEADFAQDSPPALTLVTNSSTTEGQVLAVWSKEVQPIAPIAGFVNSNKIYLNFVQALNASSVLSNSQFSLTVNGSASTITVTNVSIESNGYVLLNLSGTVQTTDTISLTYTPTAISQATSNFYLTDALGAKLWVPDFSLDLSNTTNTSDAPKLLGGSAVIANGNENLITLAFNQTLNDSSTPNASQFSVISNGVALTASSVVVSGNTVSLSVSPTVSNPLIGQGDLVTVTYTPGSTADQNLTGSNGLTVTAFAQQPITTVPLNPTTSLMAGFYTPGSSTGLSNFQNIIGTDGFNFDPAVASDQKGNALAVWVYADSSDIPNQLVPGTIYSDNDTQVINDSLNASDIYFSYWNGTQWAIAAPLAATQVGTDTNVTVTYDANSNQYIAAWLNDQSTSTTGTNTATIYWSTYNPTTNTWQAISEVLSEASPDPLTDLKFSSVNGQTALFWSETQPISYSLLTADENPYLYLRLGEINGTTAKNDGSWGAGGNGTYNGNFTLKETGALENPTTKTGDPNPAVLFTDGGNLTLNSAIGVSGSAFSIEFWFKTDTTPSAITNLVSLSGLLNTNLGFDSNNNLILNFGLGDIGSGNSSIATNASNNPLSNDTWYYVVGTYSTQTQELSLYLNAQLIQTVSNVTFTAPTTSNLTLAGSSDSVYLDEVALYGSVLDYTPPSSDGSLTGLELINTLSGTNQIGNKYSTQYVEPLPPGPQVKYSLLNTTNSTWTSQTSIDPLPQVVPTQLADANTPTFDIVSATTANNNGSISPNGQADTIYQVSLLGKQNQTVSGISVTLGGVTYAVGSSYSGGQPSSLSGNQLGVVVGDSLINTLNPQSTASSLSYTVLGQTITLNLLVDTGSGTSTEAANIKVYYEPTLSNTTPPASSFTNINPYNVDSSTFTPGGVTVLGTATVTEVNDSALALIDSGFITNTTNPAMGYVLTSADFNNDGKSDVAVGNRGYTDINGNVLNNGTIQILFGGQDVLTDGESNPLTPTDLSGNPNGLLITGIADEGQANSDYPLSMATGDVNGDGITDLVIGAPNVNSQQGAVYVIYGSTSLENQTIDVTTMTASQGYVINAPNGVVAGDLFGYAVTVGNFNGNSKLDIAIGTPDANNGNGAVYVAYDGSSSVSSTTAYNGSSGEGAGFALATSHYLSGGAATFSGSTKTDDLIIGAPNYQVTVNNTWNGQSGLPSQNQGNFPDSSSISAGAVYVLTSSSNGIETNPSYTYIGTDADTPSSNGAAQDLFAGSSVVSNGDWNGDGSLDLAINSPGTNSNNGAIYLVQGKPGNQTSSQTLNTISNLIINGGLPYGQAGAVITSAGDVNDDGYEDFLITAPQGANGAGQGYVLFGSSSFLGAPGTNFDLNVTSNDNKTTFLLNGNSPFQFTGAAIAPVGDVNGDGVDDLMISAPNAAQLYTVYGHPWLADNGSIKLADISGDNGFVIDGDLYSVPVETEIYNTSDQSSTAPALINNNGTLYLAYTGTGTNNTQIYFTTSQNNGQTWSSPIELPSGMTTSSSPSLAFYNNTLYLAYVGGDGQLNITYSTDNGQTWSSQYTLGLYSAAGVSLTVYQNQLLAFFVDTEFSNDILYVYSDNPQSSSSWSTNRAIGYQTTSAAIAATVLNDTLYLGYRGGTVGDANNYYVTSTNTQTLNQLSWEISELSGITTPNTAPSLTNDGTNLYFTYADQNTDIYYLTSTNGSNWSTPVPVRNQTTSYTPSATVLGNLLYLGYAGENTNIYVTPVAQNQSLLPGTGQDVVMLGDINGDGFADVLAGGSPNGAVIIFGNSTKDLLDAAVGTDDLIVNVPGATIQQLTSLGDYNGDGLQDFGVIDSNNNFYAILGNANLGGQGTLYLGTANVSLTSVTEAEATGDYNGDGYDDILLTVNGAQSIYKGNTSGNLSSSVAFTSQGNTVFNAIGDVNGDGYGDIGGGNPNSNVNGDGTENGQVTVYLGNASANSANSTNITPPTAAISGTLNNNDWSFNGFGSTSLSPSFAVFYGYLYMVYEAFGTLHMQRSADGYNWEGNTSLGSSFESSDHASLAVFNNTLYLAFTAEDNKVIVTPATTDSSSDLGLTFDSSNSINAGGNTSAPGPTLAVYDGELYLFFAADNNTRTVLYTTSSDGSTWSGSSILTTSSGNNATTGYSMGVAVDGDNLLVSFIGYGNNDVNVATYNGTSWSNNEVGGETSSEGPNLLSLGDTLYLFFTANNSSDKILYITSTDGGSTWSSNTVIPNQTTSDNPFPVLFQERILVGYATTNETVLGIATSNPIYEPNQTQQFGQQLQNIGDFNGDGIADLAVLASGFISNLGSINNNLLENNQGAVLIYYGTTAGITNTASPDVVLATPAPNSSTSTANNQAILLSNFSGAGDINGDGYDDLLISSPNSALNSQNTTDGEILVVFGGQNSLWGTTYSATNPFNLGNITPQTSTLTLQFNQPLIATDIPSTSSFSVKNGLNTISVNGVAFNGTNEIILTLASNANISDFLAVIYTPPTSGTSLTYATGKTVATFTSSSSAVISTLGAPTLSLESYAEYGFAIAGLPNSQAGISLSGGGDVNGDGFSDFIIGAPGNNDNLTYTLFGSDFNNTVSQTGTIGDDVMLGSPTGESFLAGQGDDKIYGKGGLDVVYAGPGDDYVTVTDTYFQRLDGGAGTDLLAFTGYNGQDWDLTTLSPGLRLRNFEILVTENYGANTLTLNSLTVTELSSNNTLTLAMDDADTLILSSDFSAAGTAYQYNQKFYKYISSVSAATVLVNQAELPTFTASSTNSPLPILSSSSNSVARAFAVSNDNPTPTTQNFVTTQSETNAPTQLFVSNPTGAELDGSLDFIIQRTGDLTKSVLVSYITQDGDGKAGDRYLPVVGQFVFAPNETSKTVTVKIPNNGRYVGDRQFGLLVSLVKEGSDLAELPQSFDLEADANGAQIRRWSLVNSETPQGLFGGTLQFDTTVSNGQAQINLSVSDIGDFNSFYSYNSQTNSYEELMLDASSTGAILTDSPEDENNTPDGIQLNFIKDGDRGDVDNIVNGLAKTNGYAARTIPGLITNNNQTFWAPTTADGQVQWRLIGTPTKNYELGWILVDDQNGTINGLKPTDTGYEAAALARKQVIFQDQNSSSNKALTRTLAQASFTNPSDLAKTESQFFGNLENSSLEVNRFYMLYTTEGAKTTFSVTDTPEIQTDSRGYHQLSFNGITAEIGSSTLVIPGVLNQSVQMEASLSRAAAYNNLIALYQVDSLTGGLDTNGDKLVDLQPGDLGYSEAALTRAKDNLTGVTLTTPENLGTTQQTIKLLGNNMYGMVIIPNATIEQVLNQNPSNNPNLGPVALFSFGSASPDGISHMARLGSNLFGFEDLVGGGDQDYNDMILQIKIPSLA